MPSYLVETYLARCRADERAMHEASVRSAAESLARTGVRVSFEGVVHVPEDESCFLVVGAPSSEEAMELARLAGLDPIRVVEAVTSGKEFTR